MRRESTELLQHFMMDEIDRQLERLDKEYPLVPHTHAGRLFSSVRRMRAEKEMGIPIARRSGFAISVKTGKHANQMIEQEWETFYRDLCAQLKREFPELYNQLFADETSARSSEGVVKQDTKKTEYTEEEIHNMSETELVKLMQTPGWVIKDGKIVKVSDKEYAEAQKNYEKHKGHYDSESI